jgi:hypothetical protein
LLVEVFGAMYFEDSMAWFSCIKMGFISNDWIQTHCPLFTNCNAIIKMLNDIESGLFYLKFRKYFLLSPLQGCYKTLMRKWYEEIITDEIQQKKLLISRT